MPKACVEKMIKQGKTPAQAHKLCYSGQEAGTSPKEELARTRSDLAYAHGGVKSPIRGKGKIIKKGVRRQGSKAY